MFIIQIVIIESLFLLFTYLTVKLLRLCPLFIFSIGFIFRLTDNKVLIDLGYYFTEYSFLFIYILFAITFFLGQLRYWKK